LGQVQRVIGLDLGQGHNAAQEAAGFQFLDS
jgi:hypothetical protein